VSVVEYKRAPTPAQRAGWERRDAANRAAKNAKFVRLKGLNYVTKSVYVMHRVPRLDKSRTPCGMRTRGSAGVEWFDELPEGTSTLCCITCFPRHLKPV
jgi:hypothetical protein